MRCPGSPCLLFPIAFPFSLPGPSNGAGGGAVLEPSLALPLLSLGTGG